MLRLEIDPRRKVGFAKAPAVQLNEHDTGTANRFELSHHVRDKLQILINLNNHLNQGVIRRNLNTVYPANRYPPVFDRRIAIQALYGLVKINYAKTAFFQIIRDTQPDYCGYDHRKSDNYKKANSEFGLD
jgi:hypothetical protein